MKRLVIFLVLIGFTMLPFVIHDVFSDSDSDDYMKFDLDGFYIYADNKHITNILLDWNGDSLPHGTITFDENTNYDINIMIPKNIPRTMNVDFDSSMAVFYPNALVVPIKELETDCFYHLRIPVNDTDEITIDSISVAAGRLESVAVNEPKCDDVYKHYSDTYGLQSRQTRHIEPLTPEPEQDNPTYENCGPETSLENGVCVVEEHTETNSTVVWGSITGNPAHQATIENIDGHLFRVIGPFTLQRESEDRIHLGDTEFTYPYYPVPVMPGGVMSVKITFSDGTKESIGTVGPATPFIEFTDHDNPKAGVRRDANGIFQFLLSIERQPISPLKQFHTGIPIDEIQCRGGLVLLQKYDGLPVCVKSETKTKLIERGWTGKVRDANSLQQEWTYSMDGEISSIDVSENDSIIAVGTTIRDTQKGMLYLLDNDGTLLWKKEFDSMIGHVDMSNEIVLVQGYHLCGGGGGAIGHCNYTADVFDVKGNKRQSFAHHDETAFNVSLSPKGEDIITSTPDILEYFDLGSNKSWTLNPDRPIDWATFLTDSMVIAKTYNTGEIFALNNTGNKIWNFTTTHSDSYSWATSNDGNYFAVSDDTSPDDGNIYLLDSSGSLLWKDNIGDTVLHLALSRDGSHILVETNDTFMIYDMQGNRLWKNNIPSDLAISSDGSFLVGTTFNQGTGASITVFDGSGNILSNHPISKKSLGSVFALANNDKYIVMANDTNQMAMFEINPDFDKIEHDLTVLRNSDDLHVKIVPKTPESFDVAIENGDSMEIPWDIRIDDGYTRSNLRVSIASDPGIESWITPTSPYTTTNGIPPGEKIITIHPTQDAKIGHHTIKILGRGDLVHNQTGWMTKLDEKTLGTINVNVIPTKDSLSIKTGEIQSERNMFCVELKSSGGGTTCTGLVTYQKMPITVFSNITQTVMLDATTVQKGGWVKFVPKQIVAMPNGTTSDMFIAGYLIPFRSNPLSEKSLIIEASSENESTTTVIPILVGTISVINDEPSPISLGKIRANSNGTHYSISDVVYDPLDSDKSIPVSLSVAGLWKDGTISDLPEWLAVDIPKQSFALNSSSPYYFMTTVQTDNAPSGTYHIAVNENIDGENFTELQDLIIENILH